MREHVQQEEQLSVADTRQPRRKAARRATLILGAYGILVSLPVLAVRGVGDQVVEGLAGMAVVRQRAAIGDVVGVAPGRVRPLPVSMRSMTIIRTKTSRTSSTCRI
jgi:hypothetical protein